MKMTLDTAGILLVQIGLVVIMFSMGLQVTGAQIGAALRRRGLMSRALLANLLLLPLVALGLSRLVAMPDDIAAGFLIASIAPGAGLSPKLSEIARADLSFAVGLTFVLATVSVVATPLLGSLMLPDNPTLQFNPLQVIRVLIIFQLIPLLVGLAVHRFWPRMAGRLRRPSILLANFLFAVVVAFYVIRDAGALMATPPLVVAAMVIMTICSLVGGWYLGGPNRATRRTLAMATSVEFTGLALLITALSFPGTRANITVVAFGLIMVIANTGAALVWHRSSVAEAAAKSVVALHEQPAVGE